MRLMLLPRSRPGIWLLAAAVWVSACLVLWHVLPAVPTFVSRFPDHSRVLGFSPAHGVALTQPNSLMNDNELQLSDLKSGLPVHRLPGLNGFFSVMDKSEDGSVWLLSEASQQGLRAVTLDLNYRAAVAVAGEASDSVTDCRLSPDGRFAAVNIKDEDGLLLWNVPANRRHTFLPALRPPYEFSQDGKRVAGIDAWTSTLRVFDVESGRFHAEFDWPARRRGISYSLDRTGDRVAGWMQEFGDGGSKTVRDFHFVWQSAQPDSIVEYHMSNAANSPDGFYVSHLRFRNDIDRLLAIVNPADSDRSWLAEADAGGRLVRRMELPGFNCEFSPDGRGIMCSDENSPARILADYAGRIGLNLDIGSGTTLRVIDVASGRRLCQIPYSGARVLQGLEDDGVLWSPDGRQLLELTGAPERHARLYAVPPRKSLTWFASGATLFALPLAWLARRRVRKLRAVAA